MSENFHDIMTEKMIEDREGQRLKVFEYNGHLLQPFPGLGPRLDALPNLTVRGDDMMVLGFPKSGNHWAWEICHRLLSQNLGDCSQSLTHLLVEVQDDEYLCKQLFPRVLVSHLPLRILSRTNLFDGDHRIVYVIRNPKDTAVSTYLQTYAMKILYEYDGKWDDFFELFLNGNIDSGSWFDHVLHMEKFSSDNPKIPIHFVFYEKLQKDLMGEIRKLAAFLDVERDEELLKKLHEISTFNAMKENHDKHASKELKAAYRDGVVDMFRKGVIGDWKRHFTKDQSKRMNLKFETQMKGSMLKFPFMDELNNTF